MLGTELLRYTAVDHLFDRFEKKKMTDGGTNLSGVNNENWFHTVAGVLGNVLEVRVYCKCDTKTWPSQISMDGTRYVCARRGQKCPPPLKPFALALGQFSLSSPILSNPTTNT